MAEQDILANPSDQALPKIYFTITNTPNGDAITTGLEVRMYEIIEGDNKLIGGFVWKFIPDVYTAMAEQLKEKHNRDADYQFVRL